MSQLASTSEFVEILDGFGHVFLRFLVYSLPRKDILGSYFLCSQYTSRVRLLANFAVNL
jgi:hypothetical protein